MDEIRIENLRTLKDTGYIKLKKINVLLGRNSSGKSTFARLFPLLKQGSKLKSKSGVIWFGPDVDFGTFQDAKSTSASKNETINFSFTKRNLHVDSKSLYFHRKQNSKRNLSSRLGKVYVKVEISEDERKRASYELKAGDCTARFTMNGIIESNFSINGIDLTRSAREYMYFYRHSGLLPDVYPVDTADSDAVHYNVYTHLLKAYSINSKFISIEMLERLPIEFLSNRRNLEKHLDIESGGLSQNALSLVRSYLMWKSFPLIWETVRDSLTESFNKIRYTKPVRASAERYYRTQGLSVDEIDPQGANLAMFLNDLSPRAASEFSKWTAEHLGFSIESKKTEGHVSIFISDAVSGKTNMADTGFGFSQVAPILAQLWQCIKSREKDTPYIFVIEQPELHLHPHMQSKLARLFSAVASSSPHIQFVIETHSEVFINQFGSAIEEELIQASQIGIYIFEKSSDSGETSIIESHFDENGFLEQWPYGFFDA